MRRISLLLLCILFVGVVSAQPLYSQLATTNEYCICLLYNEEAVLNQPFRLVFEFQAYRNMTVESLVLKTWLVWTCGNYYLLHSSTIIENQFLVAGSYIKKVIIFNVALPSAAKDPILVFEVFLKYSHENGSFDVKKSIGAVPVRSVSYSSLEAENSELKKEVAELSEKLNEMETLYLTLKANYTYLSESYSELSRKYEKLLEDYINVSRELEKIRVLYASLTRHLSNVSESYEELHEEHVKVLNVLEDYKAKYSNLKKEYENLVQKYDKLTKDYLRLQREYSNLLYITIALAGVSTVLLALTIYFKKKRSLPLPPPPPPPPQA
ncbi:MAG: hypothetical protein DRJ63_04845 [Thermoprotei archaeon]|nr:MAG: hypothetical protein DRJ63_04845 [Thermoprotei archaeon]